MPVPPRARLSTRIKPTKYRFFGCSLLAVGLLIAMPHAAGAVEPLGELEVTQRLCAAGPGARLARAQRLRGNAAMAVARVLPNPSVVVEHQQSLTGPSDRETIVGLSVPLGIGGRRFLLQDAAAERQKQASAEADVTLFEDALAFREVYARAAAEQARVLVLSERQSAFAELNTTIQGLAKGGEAAGYDLLRQQAQAELHQSGLEATKARASALRSGLEAWAGSPFTFPSSEGGVPQARVPADGNFDAARPSAHILSLEAGARASALEARAAQRKWVPELDVFAGYRQLTAGPGTGRGISLGLTVPVTFFDHGQGEAAVAEAEREVAIAATARLRREQLAELKGARALLVGLATALDAAIKARARATEVEAKARILYAAGESTITELLEAFRSAEEAALAILALEEEIAIGRVRLMRASGSLLDPALDRACRRAKGGTL